MGCWNGTCMISQLPIMEGDEVVIIPISKVGDVEISPCCYSSTFFKPFPIIMYGKYNDYGCAYEVTGDTEQFINIINILSNTTKEEVKEYYKKNHGSRVTLIESYITYVERDKVSNFNFIMIHKELFDIYKNFMNFYMPTDKIIRNTYLYNNKYVLTQTLIDDNKDDILDRLAEIRFATNPYDSFINTRVPGATKESIIAIMHLDSALSVLRKMWIPQTGSGGQSGVGKLHEQLCSFYNKYITNQIQEDEEED